MTSKDSTGSPAPLPSELAPDPADQPDTARFPTGVDVEGSIEPPAKSSGQSAPTAPSGAPQTQNDKGRSGSR